MYTYHLTPAGADQVVALLSMMELEMELDSSTRLLFVRNTDLVDLLPIGEFFPVRGIQVWDEEDFKKFELLIKHRVVITRTDNIFPKIWWRTDNREVNTLMEKFIKGMTFLYL